MRQRKNIEINRGGTEVTTEVKVFLEELTPRIADLEKKIWEAYWKATTTGDTAYEEEYSQHLKELRKLYADSTLFEKVVAYREQQIDDPLLRRQIDLLYNEMAMSQMKPEEIEEIVRLETEVEGIFTRFRAEYDGKKVSENEIKKLMQSETNARKRKAVWRASKQIGAQVAEKIRQLARLRNQVAQRQGYRDYYEMALTLSEINEDEWFTLLEKLKKETDLPYSTVKKELDKNISDRYEHLRPEGVRPWHYTDPFFQEAPPVFEVDLDGFFSDKKLEELADRTFRQLNLDIDPIIKRSDLYEREGKYQHAYSLNIDREGDVRILCNLRPDAYWMDTLLHELGHAVYDKDHDPELPYLLRQPAHTATTEAIAMMMGRLTLNPDWLRLAGMSEEQLKEIQEPLHKQATLAMLIMIRWCMVMIYFERDLYADPDQDLNTLWWDYVEKFQFVPRPEGRNEPDWASKIHLGTAPVYYQNYLLGELIASQVLATLQKNTEEKKHPLVDNPAAGTFLVEKVFKPGARYHWNEMLEKATGEKLNPQYFLDQYVKHIKVEEPRKRPVRRKTK